MKTNKLFLIFLLSLLLNLVGCTSVEEKVRYELNMGIKELKNSRIEAAEVHFKNVIDLKSNNPEAYLYLGRIEMNKGNNQKALEYVNKALEYLPTYGEAYRSRAQIYSSMNERQKACENYKLAQENGIKNLANYLEGCY